MPLIGWNGCVIRIRRTSWLGMGAIEGTFKNMAAFRIAAKTIAHQAVEAVEILRHVRRSGSDINPRRRSKPEHRLRPVQYSQ